MMNKIRPLHDRVVVKRLDAENKSAGGIVIPDTAGSATAFCSASIQARR